MDEAFAVEVWEDYQYYLPIKATLLWYCISLIAIAAYFPNVSIGH